MRAYTLSLLNKLKELDSASSVTDADIVAWANNKVIFFNVTLRSFSAHTLTYAYSKNI